MPEHPFHRTPLINIMQTQSGKWGSTLGSQLFGLFQPRIYLQSWITDMSHRQLGAKWYPFHDHFCILSNPWKPSLPSSPSSRLLPPGQRARCMKVRRHQGCLWSPRGCLGLKGWIIIMAAYLPFCWIWGHTFSIDNWDRISTLPFPNKMSVMHHICSIWYSFWLPMFMFKV